MGRWSLFVLLLPAVATATVPQAPPPPAAAPYRLAYERARVDGLPLVVWKGRGH
jgi:hypothetical protein